MTLRSSIEAWNGASADDILAVYDQHHSGRGFVTQLLRLAAAPDFERGATWLLKHHLEEGHRLSVKQAADFYTVVGALTQWESQLHALQSMVYVPVPSEQTRVVETFLRRSVGSPRPFVRAWAYNGYWELARRHERYAAVASEIIHDAIDNETKASVLARLRAIVRDGALES